MLFVIMPQTYMPNSEECLLYLFVDLNNKLYCTDVTDLEFKEYHKPQIEMMQLQAEISDLASISILN